MTKSKYIELDDNEKSRINSSSHNSITSKNYVASDNVWQYRDDKGGIHQIQGNRSEMKAEPGNKPINQTKKALGVPQ